MKKAISIMLCFVLFFAFAGCAGDAFGHEIYTTAEEYSKIFELLEIRFDYCAMELFPKSIDGLTVTDFYCEWELGVVGSATAEILLSVEYAEADFNAEINRIKSLADGKIIYDTENFEYPAYVSILGYDATSYYALVDAQANTVHYVLLQIIGKEKMNIVSGYLPYGYHDLGDVEGLSYNVYV